jgi:prepilin-type N-terminal cleavage/methylation domain-containing protein
MRKTALVCRRGQNGQRGFTILELLVVIAIIAILFSLLFVALSKAQESTRRTKAKAQVKMLEKAFVAYHDEYGEWPRGMTSYDNQPEGNLTGVELEEKGALMLAGKPTDNGNGEMCNAQGIPFITKPNLKKSKDGQFSKKGFLDPWGHCYKYMMDFNDDGEVRVQYTGASGAGDRTEVVKGYGVVVWSRGPNGMDESDGDDITSWKVK